MTENLVLFGHSDHPQAQQSRNLHAFAKGPLQHRRQVTDKLVDFGEFRPQRLLARKGQKALRQLRAAPYRGDRKKRSAGA